MFEVKIIADSTNEAKNTRLTTFQLKYPRFFHSELMTHRVFSRNASSSRAIPIKKMIEMVEQEPAMPIEWGKNQKGMQAKEVLDDVTANRAGKLWVEASRHACAYAQSLETLGVHKQITNRLLEPFQWISVIVTATDYKNFFELRTHEDAQPEFRVLARMMEEEYNKSVPEVLLEEEYHLPYIKDEEYLKYSILDLAKMSAARCARVSYLTHDGKEPSPEKDFELYERLVGSQPMHCSPVEHQARLVQYGQSYLNGNFDKCWVQFRKLIEIKKQSSF